MESRIVTAVYADGGCIGPNPSPIGGMYAYCHVDAEGDRVRQGFAAVPVANVPPLEAVSNNIAELWALVMALRALPNGWSGTVYSDSLNALGRMFQGWATNGVPEFLVKEMHVQRARMGRINHVLLDGHPDDEELAKGIGHRGHPVSIHNRFCDDHCKAMRIVYTLRHAIPDKFNLTRAEYDRLLAMMKSEMENHGYVPPKVRPVKVAVAL